MKKYVVITIIIIVVGVCFAYDKSSSNLSWYKKRNLHHSTVIEWSNAREANKIATSADWILGASQKIRDKVEISKDINLLKLYANNLVICIDKIIEGIEEVEVDRSQKVTDLANICMSLNGWL